jgi:hypothetical protein
MGVRGWTKTTADYDYEHEHEHEHEYEHEHAERSISPSSPNPNIHSGPIPFNPTIFITTSAKDSRHSRQYNINAP